jgi:phosphoglycolate phosphatase/putative hydrolase of the HAD superfamily
MNTALRVDRLRAVLFDLDGTLYSQPPLRILMGLELLLLDARVRLSRQERALPAIVELRRAQEHFRTNAGPSVSDAITRFVAERTHLSHARVEEISSEWLHSRPLKYLRHVRRRGVRTFLQNLRQRGIRTAVVSDYPAAQKLAALRLTELFDVALCTTEAEIDALKPSPRGLLIACERLGIPPEQAAYIGDRPEVDAAAAAAAGMASLIIGAPARSGEAFFPFTSFQELDRVFQHTC